MEPLCRTFSASLKQQIIIVCDVGVFDLGGENSSGYNIKTGPSSMIEVMKFDMGVAAAAFGAAKAIASIKPLGMEVGIAAGVIIAQARFCAK